MALDFEARFKTAVVGGGLGGVPLSQALNPKASARLIATSWRQELSDRAELRALLGQLERENKIERIDLEPLEHQEVSQLARLSGVESIPESLYQETNGNPYFVLETLHALLESDTTLVAEIPVSANLQDAVMRRVDRLGVPVRRLLEAASLMGNGFHLEDITSASTLGEWDALEALEAATHAGLLAPLEAGLGYVFSHDLTRRSLEAQLSPARQHLIQTTLAQRLESLGTQPARIAYHLERAGQRSKALSWRLKAAQAALRVYANLEALALYDAALEDGPNLETAFEIQVARAKILTTLGKTEARETTINALEDIAEQLGNEKRQVDATLLRITLLNDTQHSEEAVRIGQNLLPRDLTSQQCIETRIALARGLMSLGRLEEAEKRLHEVLAKPHTPLALIALTHSILCGCAKRRGDLGAAREHVNASLQLYLALGDVAGELEGLISSAQLAIQRDELVFAAQTLEDALIRAQTISHASHQLFILTILPWVYLNDGLTDRAEDAIERAEMLNAQTHQIRLAANLELFRALVAQARGNMTLSLAHTTKSLGFAYQQDTINTRVVTRIWSGRLHFDANHFDLAETHFLVALEIILGSDLTSHRLPVEVGLARLELHRGKVNLALSRLEEARVFQSVSDAEDLMEFKLVFAEIKLRLNDPQAALAEIRDEGKTPAQRKRRQALQLEAQRVLGFMPNAQLVT
jgi:tetratricopeptide (TPR) repeat protein